MNTGLCLHHNPIENLRMSCKEKVVQSCFGAQNRSVLCSHSIPFKALKPVSGSMLLFRKFKASLGTCFKERKKKEKKEIVLARPSIQEAEAGG